MAIPYPVKRNNPENIFCRQSADGPQAIPSGSIAARLDHLAALVSECNAAALALRERLSPAMFPPPDNSLASGVAAIVSPTCAMGNRIDSIADSALDAKRVIDDIASRLAI